MRLNIGSSDRTMPGFLNIDIRRARGVDRRGHAGRLAFAGDGTVDVIFTNALFEHVFLGQQLHVLTEWRRVLAPDGFAVSIGIPYFREVARAYLDEEIGPDGARFDLLSVYGYTHGAPETRAPEGWASWRPDRRPRRAPAGWLPQLHKALFDGPAIYSLLEHAGLDGTAFRYRYPGEHLPVNLGFVAGSVDVKDALDAIPGVGDYVDRGSVSVVEDDGRRDRSADRSRELGAAPVWKRYARPIAKALRLR